MSSIGNALKSFVGFMEKAGTALNGTQASGQAGGNTALLNATALSTMAQHATTPTQQEAMLKTYGGPATLALYNQLPYDQQQSLAAAFTASIQSPGGAAAALNAQRMIGNNSAEGFFLANATPAQLNVYSNMAPDQQRMAQAAFLLGAFGGAGASAPKPVPALGSLFLSLKG